MRSLSLKSLLYLIATAPLLAFLWASGESTYVTYQSYARLESQQALQKLANAGGAIAQALPAEAFAKPEQRVERRQATDTAIANLQMAFDGWKSEGNSDPSIEKSVAFITEKRPQLQTYRQTVDAGVEATTIALATLQPASAAGLDLVRRSAAAIDDLKLARLIDGFHALMQVNDAGLIEFRSGEAFLGGRTLSHIEFTFMLHAKGLRDRYTPQMREFLPADIVREYENFAQGQGLPLVDLRKRMYTNEIQGADPDNLKVWTSGNGAQAGLMAGLVARTATALQVAAQNELSTLRSNFLRGVATSALICLLALALCFVVVRHVSQTIRAIKTRMMTLADGDSQTSIPYTDRTDEIGDMAQSVEIFRQAAIRNAELEADAAGSRQRAEAERAQVQARAEAEAEERLNQATSAMA
ncbi:nitrate- and nitrite sensing domain-containing protein, partial [Rhizobium sp. FY34]|uniref:nitrate- and nitrite sensing domain-containing protein n=1 Tax=Rhizobium sp. FY34 TaxID=2562309 RepID=UPI0010C0CAC7